MKIDRNEKVLCSWCGKISTLGEWNDTSFSQCKNREMRRTFIQLTEDKAFYRKSDTFYMCPKCGRWSRGSQLKIVGTTNPYLKKLGGESIINIIHNKNNDDN